MKRPIKALVATAAIAVPVGTAPALADSPNSSSGAVIQTPRGCHVTPQLLERMAALMHTTPQAAAQLMNQMTGMTLPAMWQMMRDMGMTPREISQCIALMAGAGCL